MTLYFLYLGTSASTRLLTELATFYSYTIKGQNCQTITIAGQGETPNTPRVGRMLGLGGSHPLQTPPTQAPPSSNRSLGSSWVELTPEANSQLVSLSQSTPDPVINLNDHLPASPAVSLAEFVEQCSDLIEGMNPRMHPSPERRSIRLPKCQLSVTPSQLFEAWRMLNQRERTGLRGGLQASEAGTGKTFVCLTILLLRARCYELASEVKKFWSLPPQTSSRRARHASGTHLPSTSRGNGLSCPSQAKGDIICYCVPTSKAREFIDAGVAPRGCAIIQAPFSVVPQWSSILASANLDPAAYNLIISYPDTPIRLKRNFTQVVKSLQPGSPAPNQALETYVFLSSQTNERIFETFTGASALTAGIMFSDESHFAMKSPAMGIAEAQSKTSDGLDLWLVSATPIRLLEDFELPMQIFSSSSDLARGAAMAELITAHVAAKSSGEVRQRFLRVWPKVFENALVHRNTLKSQFNSRPITSLRVVTPVRVLLDTPQQHINEVQEIAFSARDVIREKAKAAAENDEAFQPDYASIDGRLHFVSLFPAAAGLLDRKELDISPDNVRKLIAAMKVPNKLKVENITLFQRYLEEVSRGSPKLDFIQAEIGRMRADKQQRPPLTGQTTVTLHSEDLAIKKMVIITPTLATSVFLYLWVLKRMPQLNPVLFHTTASSTADREAALQSFQSLTARKTARHSYVLITPFSVGGTGLNLQSANYQIFVSPPSSKESETQGFARTNRTGQRLPLHHSILIMQDNPADKINIASYGGRVVIGVPFDDIKRDLVLGAPDGSKQIQRISDWGYRITNYDVFSDIVHEVYPGFEQKEFHGRTISHRAATFSHLDRLVYFDVSTVAGNVLAISDACNKFDPRLPHEKLALRDMLLGMWVHELDRPVGSLKCFLYFNVVEEVLNEQLRAHIYRLTGKRLNQWLLVRRNTRRREEGEAFSMIFERAPFAIGVQKMLNEYAALSGRAIESFEFLPNIDTELADLGIDPIFDFRITLT